jgi:hypothetical protein
MIELKAIKTINTRSLSKLLETVPLKNKKKAKILCNILLNHIKTSISEVIVNIDKTDKRLLYIPHASIAIDLYFDTLYSFLSMESYTPSRITGFIFDEIASDEDLKDLNQWGLWRKLSKMISERSHINGDIKYYNIDDVISFKKGYPYLKYDLLRRVTDSQYHKKRGLIDANDNYFIDNRTSLFDLLLVKYSLDIDDIGSKESTDKPYIIKGQDVDVTIYPLGVFYENTAFSKNHTILREIFNSKTSESVEDGRLRYIFTTTSWYDEGFMFLDRKNKSPKNKTIFKEQESYPLIFVGVFKYDHQESIKENLKVWKCIQSKIDVPFPWETMNKGKLSYVFLPKEAWERNKQKPLDLIERLKGLNYEYYFDERGAYLYVDTFKYLFADFDNLIKKLSQLGYGEDIRNSVDEDDQYLIDEI